MEKWEYIVHGDLEAAMVHIIRTASEVVNFGGGAPHVSTSLRGFEVGDRRVVISLEGGSFRWPIQTRSRVDVNVFAETRTVAHDLVQIILAVLHREAGQPSPDYGLRITKHRVETGPVRADDKISDSPRYVFSLRTHHIPYTGD